MRPVDRPRSRSTGGAVLVAIACLFTTACRSEPPGGSPPVTTSAHQVSIGDIRWYVDYEAAVEIARTEDKALWVHFGENPG